MKAIEQRDLEKSAFVKAEQLYSGRIVSLKLEHYNIEGRSKTFEIVQHGGAVVLLPITSDGKILLIQQWRRAVQEITIELPAGTLEKGEEPLVCAQRELQEETGFKAKTFQSLGGFFSAPGFCDEYLHLFLAKDLTLAPLPADEDEKIDLLPLSLKEAKHWIETNQIHDLKTVAGILRYLCLSGSSF